MLADYVDLFVSRCLPIGREKEKNKRELEIYRREEHSVKANTEQSWSS